MEQKKKIEWTILDVQNDKALLWSSKCIDSHCYNENLNFKIWEYSDLRKWLRNFANEAFQYDEKQAIIFSKLPSSDSTIKPHYEKFIDDRVFILSKEDIIKYKISPEQLKGKATQYAEKNGIYIGKKRRSVLVGAYQRFCK